MKRYNVRWQLVIYDILILLATDFLLLVMYQGNSSLSLKGFMCQFSISLLCIFPARFIGRVYKQIWRYGGIQSYIRLLAVDGCAFVANLFLERTIAIERISFPRLLSIACMNLLGALAIRMVYRYAYKCADRKTPVGKFLTLILLVFAGSRIEKEKKVESKKIKIAIIGAGRVGVSLAEELMTNRTGVYTPGCFVDKNTEKVNKQIYNIPVLLEDEKTFERMRDLGIGEVVFAITDLDESYEKKLYEKYLNAGFKIKLYDYPIMQSADGKRQIRDFDIEELLFRKSVKVVDEKTGAYYKDKVVLITGGGGSIGSELCRQLMKLNPRQVILLDIYENGVYDVQQELRIAYKGKLNLNVEIASITSRRAMARVFEKYRPQIVINAAAHKHVPLMENNCIEAVENNVFGTKILVDLCEEYGAERFMMVSRIRRLTPPMSWVLQSVCVK